VNKTQTTIIVLLALIVVALLFYVDKRQTAPITTDVATSSATDTAASSKMMVGSHAVVMTDQKPGKEVVVSAVVLGNPGFVVIHEDTNGQPGPVIGYSSLLSTGETKVIKISLNREVKDGERLYAMLHLDNGDGKFDASTDAPATDVNGDIIFQNFAVSKDASGQPIDISL
jgi:hypothetical protein